MLKHLGWEGRFKNLMGEGLVGDTKHWWVKPLLNSHVCVVLLYYHASSFVGYCIHHVQVFDLLHLDRFPCLFNKFKWFRCKR